MDKVFVVTSGCYSDYGINAIFSTRKAAQEYIDKARALHAEDDGEYCIGNVYWAADANIEEWPLDSESHAKKFDFWTAGMLLDDGAVVEPARKGTEFGHPKSKVEQCGVFVPRYNDRPIVRVRSVKSADHAMKMAVEARQGWLRENGPKSPQKSPQTKKAPLERR